MRPRSRKRGTESAEGTQPGGNGAGAIKVGESDAEERRAGSAPGEPRAGEQGREYASGMRKPPIGGVLRTQRARGRRRHARRGGVEQRGATRIKTEMRASRDEPRRVGVWAR